MRAQRVQILDQLATSGWEAVSLGGEELEWWADEMWLLISKWSPVGNQAFLTFLVDPLFDIHRRKKGEGVWAVMASREKPTYQLTGRGDSFTLSLNQGWKERLPELVEHLSGWRKKQGAEEIGGS